ncbi:MAG: hypothetical protein IPM01_07335 [Burkholderiaceae bacterium]|jgi:hypothetical protein|nr:hypothetical protein [Burkholderiaceae bacterium]
MMWRPKFSVPPVHTPARADGPAPTALDGDGAPGRPPLRETLSDPAKALMNALPDHINVTAIALDYPHVMNRIASAWSEPRMLERLVEALLIDERGGREGFPFAVADALTDLRIHRQALADGASKQPIRR